ncbi:hypothetical protein PGC08_12460 [Brevibacterium sp. BDJS002]|uniref:DUF6994 family protein n=1 Tax=Brevibacterium sp. BDJS002 TaxID=3020906 RepID=UPI0023073D1A|nr:hypothetical protein [Brevibacterium sp. BDJS002]WCE38819.1 hypothetical protein PGC08_12460 [Brevibacterium sp. BDJS002]
MNTQIDVTFDFRDDVPAGKDPDLYSSTLHEYHRTLWSKQLPSGQMFTLASGENTYLQHESSLGRFVFSSDAITTRLRGRASKVANTVPPESLPPDLGYTIGSAIIFPGNRVDGASTINGARGFHPRISDRFDLTLECIRRHYHGEISPIGPTLNRYADFFALFSSFPQYVEFFLLQDLWDSRASRIKFLHHFDDFSTPAVPKTPGDLIDYLQANNEFIEARNSRIVQSLE